MLAIFSTSYKAIRKLYNTSLRNLCYQNLSSRVTESDFSSLWCAVPPWNFDKQSTALKQPLVPISSPMVMPIFVAQNPQLSYSTSNISVLEVEDSRKPLTSSLETTYATPRQATVGAPIDMAGKPTRKAIPHLARSIPLRLDDLFINTLPLCYRQHQSIPPHQIGKNFSFAATDPTS